MTTPIKPGSKKMALAVLTAVCVLVVLLALQMQFNKDLHTPVTKTLNYQWQPDTSAWCYVAVCMRLSPKPCLVEVTLTSTNQALFTNLPFGTYEARALYCYTNGATMLSEPSTAKIE